MRVHTHLVDIYLCIVRIHLIIYLFIYLFLRPIYWFGTCGVFDDCQYIGVRCGGWVGVYEGMGWGVLGVVSGKT